MARGCFVVFLGASLLSVSTSAFAAGSETATPPMFAIATTPNAPARASLSGVACPTASDCVAVGIDGRFALTEAWNGRVWTTTHNPYVGSTASLKGVSCVSATRCFAVGTFFDGHSEPLVETWNGRTWSATPSPRAELESELISVSCLSATQCVAVGTTNDSVTSVGLAEAWNGKRWSLMHVHDQPLGSSSSLSSVSCATAQYCVAVGSLTISGGSITLRLIETWNGQRWAIPPNPTTGADFNPFLSAVSCSSTTSCYAVGGSGGSTGQGRTLIEAWNGARWSIMHSPNPPAQFFNNDLYAVSCSAATSCVAVGTAAQYGSHSEIQRTLVESWNGTSWAVTSSPNPSGPNGVSSLDAVSCTSERCTAVGVGDDPDSPTLVLSGVVPRRAVTVSWTKAENERLQQMAAYLHLPPAATQKRAVYLAAFLTALGPGAPTTVKLPTMGTAATYTTIWAPTELAVLDSVRVQFELGSIGATRASVDLLSYLLALGGH